MEQYHEIANEMQMTQKQRNMYFQLGSLVQSNKTVNMGFKVDPNYCHEIALGALEAVNWKSMKAAKAILVATREIR